MTENVGEGLREFARRPVGHEDRTKLGRFYGEALTPYDLDDLVESSPIEVQAFEVRAEAQDGIVKVGGVLPEERRKPGWPRR